MSEKQKELWLRVFEVVASKPLSESIDMNKIRSEIERLSDEHTSLFVQRKEMFPPLINHPQKMASAIVMRIAQRMAIHMAVKDAQEAQVILDTYKLIIPRKS